MNKKGKFPAPGDIERELMEHIEKDEVTKAHMSLMQLKSIFFNFLSK